MVNNHNKVTSFTKVALTVTEYIHVYLDRRDQVQQHTNNDI